MLFRSLSSLSVFLSCFISLSPSPFLSFKQPSPSLNCLPFGIFVLCASLERKKLSSAQTRGTLHVWQLRESMGFGALKCREVQVFRKLCLSRRLYVYQPHALLAPDQHSQKKCASENFFPPNVSATLEDCCVLRRSLVRVRNVGGGKHCIEILAVFVFFHKDPDTIVGENVL